MQSLVGIIRTGTELEEALGKIEVLEERAVELSVKAARPTTPVEPGHRPPLHAHRVALHHHGALNRKESRGGQTRDDFRRRSRNGQGHFVERITDPSTAPTAPAVPVGAVDHQSARTGPGPADDLRALLEEAL